MQTFTFWKIKQNQKTTSNIILVVFRCEPKHGLEFKFLKCSAQTWDLHISIDIDTNIPDVYSIPVNEAPVSYVARVCTNSGQ